MGLMKTRGRAYARRGLHRYDILAISVCKELKRMEYKVDLKTLDERLWI